MIYIYIYIYDIYDIHIYRWYTYIYIWYIFNMYIYMCMYWCVLIKVCRYMYVCAHAPYTFKCLTFAGYCPLQHHLGSSSCPSRLAQKQSCWMWGCCAKGHVIQTKAFGLCRSTLRSPCRVPQWTFWDIWIGLNRFVYKMWKQIWNHPDMNLVRFEITLTWFFLICYTSMAI